MLIISISVFICIALAVMAIYWSMFRPVSATASRLRDLADAPAGAQSTLEHNPVTSVAERIAEPLNRLLPPSAANARKLQKELMQAGFRSPFATSIYRASQMLSMIAFPALILFVWTII